MSSSCTLVADSTDDAVQMLLGLIALSSLYAKWRVEWPRRSAKVWFMDALKQGSSAAMIHVMNIVLAISLVVSSDTPSDQDQCAFYFMNVVIDTTLGVYIAYLLLQLSTIVANRQQWRSLQCHGYYGDPPAWKVWWIQLLQWCTILAVMKVFVGGVIYAFSTPLGWMGSLLFYPVHNHPKIELLIVMIGCPLVMNMVQFWVQDSFLMNHAQHDNEELPLLQTSVAGAALLQKPRSVSNVSNAADVYDML
uniref:Vacuolar membrane protein n=1 Tax=Peronospora matthiolae TaxID=2874970 RepID=A0AAV1TAS1_9STRA